MEAMKQLHHQPPSEVSTPARCRQSVCRRCIRLPVLTLLFVLSFTGRCSAAISLSRLPLKRCSFRRPFRQSPERSAATARQVQAACSEPSSRPAVGDDVETSSQVSDFSRRYFLQLFAWLGWAGASCAEVKRSSEKLPEDRFLNLRTGARMPLSGLGTWEAPRGEVYAAVSAALRAGVRHFDCAPVYKNEREVGQALSEAGVAREEVWLTSKLWNDRRRPEDVRRALEKTLRDLSTSYLDLYLIHWPVVWAKNSVMKPDPDASLREAWRTLEQLVDEGKVRHIGVSNYNQAELEELLSYARIKPEVNQIELHPRLPQTALVDFCQSNDIAVTAYSPLGRGGIKGAGMLEDPRVMKIAGEHDVSPASVLLKWNLQRNVAVIPKSVSPARIASNAQEPWQFELSPDDMMQLGTMSILPGRFCTAPWSTFQDRTLLDSIASDAIGAAATAVFSMISLDVTE